MFSKPQTAATADRRERLCPTSLILSIYVSADENHITAMVRRPLPDAAQHGVSESGVVLPSLLEIDGDEAVKTAIEILGFHQRRESPEEHLADARTRSPHLNKAEDHSVSGVSIAEALISN
jgi:hypothetical protein